MTAYYNEIDPYAGEWLRNLIKAGHIADGVVDTRSIEDVRPEEIRDFTQCHFFAGIGVWSYALRRAGWADDRNVWTGSCPCQPFSAAGKGAGFTDERHLWPSWHHLIAQGRPSVVFGEQVASKDGLGWLDLVQSDMEGQNYAFGAVDSCAAGVGAPHIRQRLFFVADAESDRWNKGQSLMGRSKQNNTEWPAGGFGDYLANDALANPKCDKQRKRRGAGSQGRKGYESGLKSCGRGALGGLADPEFIECERGLSGRREESSQNSGRAAGEFTGRGQIVGAGPVNGHWRNADWLFCRDGKWRPVESGTFPLANGAPARVGRLRAYGNAIVAQVAEEMIRAYMECQP